MDSEGKIVTQYYNNRQVDESVCFECKTSFFRCGCGGSSDGILNQGLEKEEETLQRTNSCRDKALAFIGGSLISLGSGSAAGCIVAYKLDSRTESDGETALSPWVIPLAVTSIALTVLGGIIFKARSVFRKVVPV